ncbi:hypothetical protein P3H15_49260 [Rhodococcus sp. T2V]|uniref:hypothetical protein n=1 Tax=Rhodococcus sp. T2V TaxID=3034164 RepID=UPI0023E23C34|nr:hypothetical protein [Rhodococcus sp. T2V]MDF3312923.1 hypothetical protein [Rhodococcus sp. T2V]
MTMLFLTVRRAAAAMQNNPTPGTILTVTGLGAGTTIDNPGTGLARDSVNGAIKSFTLAAARDNTLAGLRPNTIRLTAPAADVADVVPPRLDELLALLLADRPLGSGHVIAAQSNYALVPSRPPPCGPRGTHRDRDMRTHHIDGNRTDRRGDLHQPRTPGQ